MWIKKIQTSLTDAIGKIFNSVTGLGVIDKEQNAPSINLMEQYVNAVEIPQGAVVAYDGTDLPDGYEEFNGFDNYSETEIKVGTWKNGKPLYKKTIEYPTSTTIGNLSGLTDITIPHNISNFGICIKTEAFIIYSSTNYILLPQQRWDSSTSKFGGTTINGVNATNITLRIINDTWSSKTFVFTLYYTKTND